MSEPSIEHVPDQERWQAHDGDTVVGQLTYRTDGDGVIDLQHTLVDPDQRGRGIAGLLVAQALTHVRERSWRIRPSCSYVQRYLREHPGDQDLVDD
jgi:uncharacterized protein